MQTFMISSSYQATAADLDNKRLNKQLLEVRQILAANLGLTKGWVHHPATKMWKGHSGELMKYADAVRIELNYRGISWEKNWDVITKMHIGPEQPEEPQWMSNLVTLDKVTTSHRANLYFKDPVQYYMYKIDSVVFNENRDYFTCCDRCNYYWPTHKESW